MVTVKDTIRGGDSDEAVRVDKDGTTTARECCERGGDPAAPPRPASVDDGGSPASDRGERVERDEKPPRIMEMAMTPMLVEMTSKK